MGPMLCNTCVRQDCCLPAIMARKDARMHQLLCGLKTCGLQKSKIDAAAPSKLDRLMEQLRLQFRKAANLRSSH